MHTLYAEIILPLPLDGLFTYSVPPTLAATLREGMRVCVPLGKSKTYTGIVARIHDDAPEFEVRDITAALDTKPMVLPRQLALWQWMADYYMSSVGEVYKAAMPAGLKEEDGYRPRTETCIELAPAYRSERALHLALDSLRRATRQQQALTELLRLTGWDTLDGDTPTEETREVTREELINSSHCTAAVIRALTERGILYTYEREVGRIDCALHPHPERIQPLSTAQEQARQEILAGFAGRDVVLLHGVTSSGKTEVYIHLIAEALDRGEQVLYLVPEIALTVQMMDRLRRVFGHRLGIYHSRYSDDERVEIWQKQLSSEPYGVILGARSAVLLPFQRLGLVIVDEEHETSFKQQDPAPRYHARSTALMLARQYGAKTLLGSATPGIETYRLATTGRYALVTLTQRYRDLPLPRIEVVDVRDLRRRRIMRGIVSPPLLAAMRSALAAGQQVILFQNRRGFTPVIECHTCGWTPRCQNCDVSLTYHKVIDRLVCHYCGYSYPVPGECPACEGKDLRGRGFGTEKIEDEIRETLPEARVARMDMDTTRTQGAYSRIISEFARGDTNVLIGTQMVTKGLDFDHVGVVGILDADSMLNYPDFRAWEHAFTLMMQVSGRAGRKDGQGLVMLQTRNVDQPVIRQVMAHDYRGFYLSALAERREFCYPPFCRLIYVYLRHRQDSVAESAALELAGRLRQTLGHSVLGPDKPAVARVKNMSLRMIIVKTGAELTPRDTRQALRTAQQQLMQDRRYATLQVYYDVDPA